SQPSGGFGLFDGHGRGGAARGLCADREERIRDEHCREDENNPNDYGEESPSLVPHKPEPTFWRRKSTHLRPRSAPRKGAQRKLSFSGPEEVGKPMRYPFPACCAAAASGAARRLPAMAAMNWRRPS